MATGSIFEQMIDPANRADPWPLYRELRKTPVTRETDGTYVVSRYRDIVALIHDPRVSAAGGVALPGRLVNLDPPAHDRIRQSLMRHYGPPEAPGRIESMRADLQYDENDPTHPATGRLIIDPEDLLRVLRAQDLRPRAS